MKRFGVTATRGLLLFAPLGAAPAGAPDLSPLPARGLRQPATRPCEDSGLWLRVDDPSDARRGSPTWPPAHGDLDRWLTSGATELGLGRRWRSAVGWAPRPVVARWRSEARGPARCGEGWGQGVDFGELPGDLAKTLDQPSGGTRRCAQASQGGRSGRRHRRFVHRSRRSPAGMTGQERRRSRSPRGRRGSRRVALGSHGGRGAGPIGRPRGVEALRRDGYSGSSTFSPPLGGPLRVDLRPRPGAVHRSAPISDPPPCEDSASGCGSVRSAGGCTPGRSRGPCSRRRRCGCRRRCRGARRRRC